MDVVIGIVVLAVVLVLWVVTTYIDLAISRLWKRGPGTAATKIGIAVLLGFMAYVVTTPKIEQVVQKLAVSAMILVMVGIFVYRLREKNGE